jgi:hypothetical protein
MIFSPIRLSHREAIDRIRARYHRQTSAWFAFHSLYLWQDTLGLSILLEDELFVVAKLQKTGLGEAVHRDRDGWPRETKRLCDVDGADFVFAFFFLKHEDAFQIVLGGFE